MIVPLLATAIIVWILTHLSKEEMIAISIFLMILYMLNKNSQDVGELKKIIEEHNELMKKDIEQLKKKE